MTGTLFEVQAAVILPAVQNCIAALNINTTAAVVDLTSLRSPLAGLTVPQNGNVIGHYVRVTATAGTVYYATGNTNQVNALANINASNYSTLNTSTHQLTITGYECEPIPAGSYLDIEILANGTAKTQTPFGGLSLFRYIALVTQSNTSIVTIRQSST